MSPLATWETSCPRTASTSDLFMSRSRPVLTATSALLRNIPVANAFGAAESNTATSGMQPGDVNWKQVRLALDEIGYKGYLTPELMDAVAEYLELPKIQVYEVATFYSMFQTKPVGRHNVAICTNVSCMLRGADDIVEHVEAKLGVRLGESTGDGRIYLKREEVCLAACCGAPMMVVDGHYHENLDTEKVDKILDGLD